MKNKNTWGISSLCCGIAGFVLLMMPYFGIVFSILAVVFSSKQKKIESSGQATAGNVLGIIGICINSMMLLLLAVYLLIIAVI